MMKRLLITLLSISILTACASQEKDKKLIKQSFENYKNAILNDKGAEAVKYVDSRTVKYYSDMLEKIKYADSTEVDMLPIIDKVMVFAIRHRTAKEDILKFDGKGLIIYAVENSMIGKNSVAGNTVSDIDIDGTFATGKFGTETQETPFRMHFYKEEDIWKIDLTAMFAIGAKAFTSMQKESGMAENEYLFSILEYLTGRKPGNEIWNTLEE